MARPSSSSLLLRIIITCMFLASTVRSWTSRAQAWVPSPYSCPSRTSRARTVTGRWSGTLRSLSSASSSSSSNNTATSTTTDDPASADNTPGTDTPPWSRDVLTVKKTSRNNATRIRQHVNPLARKFQQPTLLSENWPRDVFDDCQNRPLALDIGSAKGGFLLTCATQKNNNNSNPTNDYNYLGLEIRPTAVQFARDRLHNNPEYQNLQGRLDFVGCNANVDLERLLSLYREASGRDCPLDLVTIQFPDPHFKKSHHKRRVVKPELVRALPAFMPPGARVFLQSDIQSVLDDMRDTFRQEASGYLADQITDPTEYIPENILGIPTEREISVLKRDLPVFRALFTRTDVEYPGPP